VAPLFDPFGFLLIHRSYAVNLRRPSELRPRNEGEDCEVKLEPPASSITRRNPLDSAAGSGSRR
jgi:DNA-binding LytR/AlgR family response regulator